MSDIYLGRDGCGSDEIVNEFRLRDGRLIQISLYDGREREVDPIAAVAELERRAGVSRDMAALCQASGGGSGDYPFRARAEAAAAAAICREFGL